MDKIEITDELLYRYCPDIENNLLDELPKEEDIDYIFSKNFEKKMKKMIKKEKRHPSINRLYNYTKRVAVLFIVLLVGLFTITMSVDAYRVKFFNMVKELYQQFTIYKFRVEEKIDSHEFKKKELFYIPNGFKEIDRIEDKNDVLITYSNGYDSIKFSYFKIKDDNYYLDTENVKINNVFINNIKAEYIEKEGIYMLIWQDDSYLYNLNIESLSDKSYIDVKSEIIKIAKNIK